MNIFDKLIWKLATPEERIQWFGPPPPKPNRRTNVNNLRLSVKALTALIYSYNTLVRRELLDEVMLIVNNLIPLYDSNPHDFVNHMKGASVWFARWVMSGELHKGIVQDEHWDSVHNCPDLLEGFWPKFLFVTHKSVEQKVLIHLIGSVLMVYRNVVVAKVLDVRSITDKQSGRRFTEPRLLEALAMLGITPETFMAVFKQKLISQRMHFTSASGPNGPALTTAHLDARAVLGDVPLASAMKKWCSLTKQMRTWVALLNCSSNTKIGEYGQKMIHPWFLHSKLHIIYEKGDKSRVIAIADYWTQEVMSVLHDTINHFLKNVIDSDFTFDQDAGVEKLKRLSLGDYDMLGSLDLSAATDRLPVWFQSEILSLLFRNKEIGQTWSAVMRNRSFWLPQTNQYLRYSVGQPMGIKSSFAMLALTHHVIVQLAALDAGKRSYDGYTLLGDDVVLTERRVIMGYRAYMTRLGLDISEHKSVIATQTGGLGGEFCRRSIHQGQDMSPVPPGILLQVARSGRFGPQFQNELERRGLVLNDSHFWILMNNLLSLKWFKMLAVMNGMPGSVTGLIRPVPNRFMPLCNAYNVAVRYGLDLKDWENVSYFIDAKQALQQSVKAIQTAISRDMTAVAHDAMRKVGYDPIYLELEWNMVDEHGENMNPPGEIPQTYEMAWPKGMDKLEKLASRHPFFQVIYDSMTETFNQFNSLEFYGGTDDSPFQYKYFLDRRFLVALQIVNLTRNLEDYSDGIRQFSHVFDVLDVLKKWIKDPEHRRLSFSTSVPYFMDSLILNVASGKSVSMSRFHLRMKKHAAFDCIDVLETVCGHPISTTCSLRLKKNIFDPEQHGR